ncbi:ATP-dependent DNA helicase RecG [Vulcanococcus limneticus]|uniref:ATP-dependent DNA helicase RecG n=1 Tax=Vulcanococcus limneticus TaxID=2170428 RepID=UPI00398C218F
MVAGQRPDTEPLGGPAPAGQAWFRPLQQALQLEAERGFDDLQGRRERFSAFLARQCQEAPAGLNPPQRKVLQELAAAYTGYGGLSMARRQALVRRTRQALHELQRALEPPSPVAPPRLRLAAEPDQPRPEPLRPGATPALYPDTPLADIRGVGPRTAQKLAALGLFVARDLLRYYPRDYLDYANLVRIAALEPGRTATIVATVRRTNSFTSPRNPNLSILELQLQDITGRLRVTKFFAGKRFSSPGWLKAQQRQYPLGATVAVSGLVKETPYGPVFQDPLMEVLESPNAPLQNQQIGRLLPVYGLTEGLTAERVRAAIQPVLAAAAAWGDPLPAALLEQEGLVALPTALTQIHQPANQESLSAARRRLVFDEFLLLQRGLLQRRRELTSRPAPALAPPAQALAGTRACGSLMQAFLELLPFPLTGAQQRVLAEIRADLAREQPMARLVQGDVGSGKTVVAIAALLTAIDAGCQSALMAPTEVLAEQHYNKLCEWLPQLHVSCALLTGSTPARRRRELLADLANGNLQLLVGTHALLEDPVQFARLGLVVVDEQHRFGVTQRNRLLDKGLQPHLLTMTATPIPRTLALSLHGDLEVSQIDELPPGRTPIRTAMLRAGERQEAYGLIRQEVAAGQRAYVVLPLVEESEKLDLRSAVEVHRQLSEEVFPELSVGLLHGRMASADKQAAIRAFARGESHVLVSTTVVEVGVDVPQASVMVIEHADRFGLAQLHQLRGRVGRGAAASHCLLINDSRNALARQRLEVLVHSSDGFEIAEMDLRLRGPGAVLGTRQSGLPDLALASLTDDGEVLEQARRVAQELMASDPELRRHPALAQVLADQRQRLSQGARLN